MQLCTRVIPLPVNEIFGRPWSRALRAAAAMATDYVFFWGHAASQGGPFQAHVFSNWLPAAFVSPSDGQRYANTEQYMMAQKALLFGDTATHAKILKTTDPKKVKALGRQVSSFDSKVWSEKCFDIVLAGNRLKFTQNPKLKDILLATGERPLAEASPRDAVWGIGLNEAAALKVPPDQWPGTNLLGKVLMVLRAELRESSDAVKVIEVTTTQEEGGAETDMKQEPAPKKSRKRLQ